MVNMPFHFGATWQHNVTSTMHSRSGRYLDYLGFAENQNFATEATLYGELAILFEVDDRVGRMTRFNLGL